MKKGYPCLKNVCKEISDLLIPISRDNPLASTLCWLVQ